MRKVKVSVIIPVYNTEKYLEKCLESVCNQTLSDIEIICINDCSTDNSCEILNRCAANDERIKIINFPENRGAAAARNAGIDAATGEYIGFVDSDDYIDLNFYEKLYIGATTSNADIVKSNLKYTGWNTPSSGSYYNLNDVKKSKYKFNHVPTAIFKRSLLLQNNIFFPENSECAEDSVFEILAASACNKIEIVEDVCYYYVFRQNSLNHDLIVTENKIKALEDSLKKFILIINDLDLEKNTYFDIIDSKYKYISYFCKNKKLTEDAKKYLPVSEKNILLCVKFREEFLKRKFEKRVQQAWNLKLKAKNKIIETFDKNVIDEQLKTFYETAVTTEKRNPRFIVSLTSYPERLNLDVHYCIFSLLNQTLKPDEIVLWLAIEEFPNKELDIPERILKFKENGLTIKFTHNIKSYKKLIPALKEYPNDVIITADDDIYYDKQWFEKLYNAYLDDDNCIICNRAHKVKIDEYGNIAPYKSWDKLIDDSTSSYLNFFTGSGGVLYTNSLLYKDIFNEELFTKLAPNADDIWFWAMAILNKTKIKIISEPCNKMVPVNYDREHGLGGHTTLFTTNIIENDFQLKNIIDYYPQILSILKSEINSKETLGV